jgi:hypothetical protein
MELPFEQEGHEEGPQDRYAQRVGLLAACIAVVLALVTIASHRSHTNALVQLSETNDQWSLYQAKRLKAHVSELGRDMLTSLRPAESAALLQHYVEQIEKNDKESKEVSEEARKLHTEYALSERQALRYDLGEAMLEVGLVLCSLYFISKRRLFPPLGGCIAMVGAAIAFTGLFLR